MLIRVLVFPGGTEIGLEIRKALCQCRCIQLHSAGSVPNHAPYVFSRHFFVPDVSNPAWIEGLNKVIRQRGIDHIFPAHDDVLVALARNVDRIEAKVISSPLQTCLITRSKSETYRFLAGVVPVPKVYGGLEEVCQFPVFVKPDKGQGSRDTHIVYDKEHLSQLLQGDRNYIVVEYLPGREYTVDCFSDREAGLLFCGGRRRVRIRNGISMNSRPIRDDVFARYARRISGKLTFHGAWLFQLKEDQHNTLKLLEVAPRLAGTMAVHRVQGVNFALLSLLEQRRVPIEILLNDVDVQIDRALVNRYRHNLTYSAVYVDLDDTLILNDAVNTRLVQLLYQCINRGVRIVLLTRHVHDLDETLRKYRLEAIFDEVVYLKQSDSKADYIREGSAILIDDSFRERKAVSSRLGIPTFDCSMFEMLLDERGSG